MVILVESIENQMKLNPNGFDPEHNFKNASSNVISEGFSN